jgi:hypothetical protein
VHRDVERLVVDPDRGAEGAGHAARHLAVARHDVEALADDPDEPVVSEGGIVLLEYG